LQGRYKAGDTVTVDFRDEELKVEAKELASVQP
jgi:hypothetical protein